jgi:hypothetical protein
MTNTSKSQPFEILIRILSQLTELTDTKCVEKRCLFLIGHMRAGSTALSNILCSRPEISGYGESHTNYGIPFPIGRLKLKQLRMNVWKKDRDYLFDKILHNSHDQHVESDFFQSTAIFLVRSPVPTILSIRNLFTSLNSNQYVTDEQAATYYCERIQHLIHLWHKFPPENRIGITHSRLIDDTDIILKQINERLSLSPPLENNYTHNKAQGKQGAGDPINANKHTQIQKSDSISTTVKPRTLAISETLHKSTFQNYKELTELFEC